MAVRGALAERWMWRLRFWGMARPFLNSVFSNICYLDSVFWDVRSVRTWEVRLMSVCR